MSDFKSKLPDLKELSSMTSKLFKGIKNSVGEIIQDYKQKRAVTAATEETAKEEAVKEAKKETTKPTKVVEEAEDTKKESTEK